MNSYEVTLGQLVEKAISKDQNESNFTTYEYTPDETVSEEFLRNFHMELDNKYEYISHMKYCKPNELKISHENLEDAVSLIAFCINRLKNWSNIGVKSINELIVNLNIAGFLDVNGCFWRALSRHEIPLSHEVIEYSSNQLSRLKSEFKVCNDLEVPIYEKESLESFLLAISSKDWVGIAELWKLFNNSPLLSCESIQLLHILDYYDRCTLISTFENCNDIPILMHIMNHLRTETAFFIGSETQNDILQFTSVYSTLSHHKARNHLSDINNDLLSTIFRKVGFDNDKFIKWMVVFNKYPLRFPNIQTALGKMLATTTNSENLEAYIKSISISKHADNESRKILSECLKEFVKHSDTARRYELWNIAYKHWFEWDFGGNNKENYIFQTVFSELDFAIVGYYKECVSHEERLSIKQELVRNMQSLESKWHISPSSANSYWYRNLSFYQVIEHAEQVSDDIDTWLLEGRYYIPLQFHENEYIAMLVG
ncbi:hypothetical protein Q9290_01200 [Oceanimonas sp. CHS3-5]|uniref:hypothetical protein n=1 Tax=Oceanimonas sp. CHS3-5 TaxID=3068186 RepID=UPI00273F883A|nr:hypothetical protein [Oceanimonas sp. CHS3-5]MDP5290915.1 hypothetical protein [Oceanimonas sp. CHS3-5]